VRRGENEAGRGKARSNIDNGRMLGLPIHMKPPHEIPLAGGVAQKEVSPSMHSESKPALLTAAMAVVRKPQMLFDVDEGSHKLVGFFIPASPMMELIRIAMNADKELERLSHE
jgi:hypothetical protein